MEEDSTTATDNLGGTQDSTATDDQTATTGSDNLETTTSTDDQDDSSAAAGTEGDDSTSTPKFDPDLDAWAEKTGRAVPESDRERELYQEIRNTSREFQRSKAEEAAKKNAEDVNKAIAEVKPEDEGNDDEDDELTQTVKALQADNANERALRQRSEFFTANQVTKEQADVMGDILKEKVAKGGKAAYDYWTNPGNLEDWHQLAKARLIDIDTSAVASEAAQKERERIAKESAAGSSRRSATNTTTAGPKGYDRKNFFAND